MFKNAAILSVIIIIIFLALAGLWIFSQNPAPRSIDDPAVAVVIPVSIPAGEDIQRGIELARRDLNAEHILLVYYDFFAHDGDVPLSEKHDLYAQAAADNPNVIAVIGGPNTDYVRQTLPIYNPLSLALISPAATSPELTQSGYTPSAPASYYPNGVQNFFRTIPSDEIQGRVAAEWLESQGHTRIALVYSRNSTYTQVLAGIFKTYAAENDLTLVTEVTFTNDDIPNQIPDLVERVANANPEAIYFPMPAQTGQAELLAALREALPDTPLMGSDGTTYDTFTDEQAAAITGTYATLMPANPAALPEAAAFVAAYEAAYDTPPSALSMTSYDAAAALFTVLTSDTPPQTRPELVAALADPALVVNGAAGAWSFTETGDMSANRVSVVQYQNNAWETQDVND